MSIAVIIVVIILILVIITAAVVSIWNISAAPAPQPRQNLPDIVIPPALPDGLYNGDVVSCEGVGIYKLENNLRRGWRSWDDYVRDGAPGPVKSVDCSVLASIPEGVPF